MDEDLKKELWRKLLDKIDLEGLGQADDEAAREEMLVHIRSLVNSEAVPLSFAERERLAREILDEIFGLGPLEPLLKDPSISDILVNSFDRIYIERARKLELTGLRFIDTQHLRRIIDRILSRIGRRIDESSPMVDAWLADGSRLNVVIPPLATDGPCLSIRRFRKTPDMPRRIIRNATVESIRLNEHRHRHGIAVAVLTDEETRRSALERLVNSTNMATILFSHTGFPVAATDSVLRPIQDQHAEVVIVDLHPNNPRRAIHTIELIRATTGDVAIFAVGEMRNPANIVAAMRAGAREFLESPPTSRDLLEAFVRFSSGRRTRGREDRSCRIFTVINAKGGSGATTLAVNVATALQQNHGPTALVDFATIGHAALHLNQSPSYSVVDALQNLHRMDTSLLEGFMTHTNEGPHLLAGSQQPYSEAPTAAELARLFDVLVNQYRYVVVDCSRRMDQTTRLLSDLSNVVLLVADTDVVSLWSVGRIREFLDETSGRDRLRLVLNRYKKLPGFTQEDVEKATNTKVFWKIPDSPLVAPSIDRGMPVARQDSEISQSFVSLARLLAEGEDRGEDGWSAPHGSPSGGLGGTEPPRGSAPPTVSVGVPRPKHPPTLPPRKMGRGA